jgi:hypothetical protein
VIDLTVDAPHDPAFTCECGDPECLGPVEIAGAIAQSLAEQLPQLQSPMLKLIKERNEARRLAVAMVNATNVNMLKQSVAMEKAFTDICKAQSKWDKRSYEEVQQ